MKILGCALALLLFAGQPPAGGKVQSEYDKKADFSKYRTYNWLHAPESYRPKLHDLLVASIDKEMAALGLTRMDTGKADLTVRYLGVRTAQVDLKEVEKLEREGNKEQAKLYDMGKLVIVLRESGSDKRLWAATTLEPLSQDEAVRQKTVSDAVAKLFQTYPARRK